MKTLKDIAVGDVLAFKAADGHYKGLICTSIYKDKSPYHFIFCALTYSNILVPTIEDVKGGSFFGVGTSKGDYFKYSEDEVERMWDVHPEIKPYVLGTYRFFILRKDFMQFYDNMLFVGNLDILDNLDLNGNGSLNASAWDYLKDSFNDSLPLVMADRRQRVFKVRAIIK
jgi:hypothetical protein